MIQDIEPHSFNNTYKHILPDTDSVVLHYKDNFVLAKNGDNKIDLPRFSDLEKEGIQWFDDPVFLFEIDEKGFFLVRELNSLPEGYEMIPVSSVREKTPQPLVFAVYTGFGFYNWYSTRVFCGKCATKMRHNMKERMLECPHCGTMEFAKISPAVIVGVINGEKLLLSKYAGREYTNYALLAGFAEPGETIENTVTREVMEEVGLKVKNLRY